MGESQQTNVSPADRVVLKVPPTIDPEEIVDRMKLREVRSTLIINGGTSELSAERREDIGQAMLTAVIELARWPGPALVTGGTDAGVFSVLGEAIDEVGFTGPVIGIVPAGKVDADGAGGDDRKPVEPHHTHVVAVDGGHWGDETPVMMGLSDALAGQGPVAVVVAGGGDIAEREVSGHKTSGRCVITLEGTGRLADQLASDDDPKTLVVDVGDGNRLAECLRSIFRQR